MQSEGSEFLVWDVATTYELNNGCVEDVIWHCPKGSVTSQGRSKARLRFDRVQDALLADEIMEATRQTTARIITNESSVALRTPKANASKEIIDRWGMIVEPDQNDPTGAALRPRKVTEVHKERKREKKWINMVHPVTPRRGSGKGASTQPVEALEKQKKVKSRARKGIPDSLRGDIWRKLSGADACLADLANQGVYQRLKAKAAPEAVEVQIRKDITRTFPKHIMFQNVAEKKAGNGTLEDQDSYSEGQLALFNVLKAFANHSPIGYCQGMGQSCGTFLMYMGEEESFWMMVQLMDSEKYCKYGNVYIMDFPLLFEFLYMHDKFCEKYCPALFNHFRRESVWTTTYANRWYQLLFAELPRETMMRIWDIFFSEGIKILFRVAIALLKIKGPALLRMDFEEVTTTMQNLPTDPAIQDTALVLNTALAVDITTKQLQAHAASYQEFVAGGGHYMQTQV